MNAAAAQSGVWRRPREAARRLWRVPLVLPALGMAASIGLATSLSVAPHLSLWGSYARRQGACSLLSDMVIFVAVAFLVRHRDQVERLVTLILLTSFPVSLYAVLQHFGADPLVWERPVTERVTGVAGNAVFLGAQLIMVIPLTLARSVEHATCLFGSAPAGQLRRQRAALLAPAYLLLLAVQVLALAYTRSRGALIGLGAGVVVLAVLLTSLDGRRRLRVVVPGLTAAGVLVLLLVALQQRPVGPQDPTVAMRLLIWEAAIHLLKADPLRAVVGHGPETSALAFEPFYPTALAHHADEDLVDRAHNALLDALTTTGVLGGTAELLLFVAFCAWTLRRLGMIDVNARRPTFTMLAAAGGALGLLAPLLLDGSFRLAGIGLPVGVVAGILVYLVAFTPARAGAAVARPESILLIGLFSAVTAHVIETQVGIAVTATRLYLWTFLGLAVALGARNGLPGADGKARDGGATAPAAEPRAAGALLIGSLMVGLILIVIVFDFGAPGFSLPSRRYAVVWLLVATWNFGALVLVAESLADGERGSRWLGRLGLYAGPSLGVLFAFIAVYQWWLARSPSALGPGGPLAFAVHQANAVTILYLFVAGLIAAGALALRVGAPPPAPPPRVPGSRLAVVSVLALPVAPAIVLMNLDPSRADTVAKHGAQYEAAGQWDTAITLYEEAVRRRPSEARYLLGLGQAFVRRAAASPRDPQRAASLGRALTVIERAHAANPLDTSPALGLARLHHTWALLADDPATRQEQIARADEAFTRAVARSPHRAVITNEWAAQKLDQRRPEEALTRLDRSLRLDPVNVNTYLLQVSAYLSSARHDEARQAGERALQLLRHDPGGVVAGLNRQRLAAPSGPLVRALGQTRAAYLDAGPAQRPALEALLETLWPLEAAARVPGSRGG